MHFSTSQLPGYLRAELRGRETAVETQEFLVALEAAAREARATRLLVVVRGSRPIFTVERYRISAYLKRLGALPEVQIALVAADAALRASHEYIEVLARHQGASVRSFRDETQAAEWLRLAPQPRAVGQ